MHREIFYLRQSQCVHAEIAFLHLHVLSLLVKLSLRSLLFLKTRSRDLVGNIERVLGRFGVCVLFN
jgi:hypothetical protein